MCHSKLAMVLAKDVVSLICPTRVWIKRLWDLVGVWPLFVLWHFLMCGCLILHFMNCKQAIEIGVVNCTLEVSWVGIVLRRRDQLFYLHWWFKCQVLCVILCQWIWHHEWGSKYWWDLLLHINLCFGGHENFHCWPKYYYLCLK